MSDTLERLETACSVARRDVEAKVGRWGMKDELDAFLRASDALMNERCAEAVEYSVRGRLGKMIANDVRAVLTAGPPGGGERQSR